MAPIDRKASPCRVLSSEAPHLSTPLGELKMSDKYILPEGDKDTAVWVIDSEFAYDQFEEDEATKVHQRYYEYSSDENEFESSSIGTLRQEDNRTYRHGTIICKTICNTSSKRTSIHFAKIHNLGNSKKHVEQCLKYIHREGKQLGKKFNIATITLGSRSFRASKFADFSLFLQHKDLHESGFVFCCSAGNVVAAGNAMPEIPHHPLSYFMDCKHCIVVGSYALNYEKQFCVPSTFGSAGCCVSDEGDTEENFIQGVTTWALGENVVIPKIKDQKDDHIVNGTSVSTAVVRGAASLILPKLITYIDRMKADKSCYSLKFKNFLNNNCDNFVCPRHGTNRKIILNLEKFMNLSGFANKR